MLTRRMLMVALMLTMAVAMAAQTVRTHKVKRGETIYGLSRQYGITEAQLRAANPGMERSDYVLKKGEKIIIPSPDTATAADNADDVRQRAIRMGVMLPLHDVNGDGRRMVEYYRGLLMACDSLRREGLSVDIYAWNTPDTGDISETLAKPEAAQCDIIFGPLYSKQMDQLSDFCQQHGTMLVIPFSINAPQIYDNSRIFQVYQASNSMYEVNSRRMVEWFGDCHVIIVDCEDPNSTKGAFTAALRHELDQRQMNYCLTSLKSADALFASAFSSQRQNVVVLNSARTSDLEVAFIKLKDLLAANEGLRVSMFGYTEWIAQADSRQANYHKYDMYIPTPNYAGLSPTMARSMVQKYRANFHTDMISFVPPLAVTGFDHAMFFLRGLHLYGKTFDGAPGRISQLPVQTPLKFEQVQIGGGYQNRAYMFVHFKTDGTIDTINY